MSTAVGDALDSAEILAIDVAGQLPHDHPAILKMERLRLALVRAQGHHLRSLDGTAAAAPARQRAPPEFPLDALPEWLGAYVAAVARSLQVPIDMPASFALGLLALSAARIARGVDIHGDWMEPLNLFVALVAPPGQKKSACVSKLFSPVHAFERELVERTAHERRKVQLERERLESALEQAKRADDWAGAEELTERLAQTPRAVVPQLTTDDVTAQKLSSLLAEHRAQGVVSAEPKIFATMKGRWSNGSGPEIDVFLAGHAGDTIKVDRQGRPAEFVEEPRLTLAIALQPEALRGFASPEIVGRGLVARFLFVVAPDVRGSSRLLDGVAIPPRVRDDFEAGVRSMLEAVPLPQAVPFSPAAVEVWADFFDDFQLRLREGGDMRELHGWGEKFPGQVARIAGALHLADSNGSADVSADTVCRAIAIGRWLERHSLDAFGMMSLRDDVREAEEILEVIVRNEWGQVTRRQLHQALKSRDRFKRVKALERGIALLTKHGWLIPRHEPARAGRPSHVFDVHPDVHSEGFEGVSGGVR